MLDTLCRPCYAMAEHSAGMDGRRRDFVRLCLMGLCRAYPGRRHNTHDEAVTRSAHDACPICAAGAAGNQKSQLAEPKGSRRRNGNGVHCRVFAVFVFSWRRFGHCLACEIDTGALRQKHKGIFEASMTAPADSAEYPWYIVHVHSGFEKKVQDSIKERARTEGLETMFGEILVPTEKIPEIRKGVRIDSERKFFPGYILVQMAMSDETRHFVKSLPKVTNFLGAGNTPRPIPEQEVEKMLRQIREGVSHKRSTILFEIGEQVRVSDGPFASFNGYVEDIDYERSRLKVSVLIFGRATPVEIEFSQVEKNN